MKRIAEQEVHEAFVLAFAKMLKYEADKGTELPEDTDIVRWEAGELADSLVGNWAEVQDLLICHSETRLMSL